MSAPDVDSDACVYGCRFRSRQPDFFVEIGTSRGSSSQNGAVASNGFQRTRISYLRYHHRITRTWSKTFNSASLLSFLGKMHQKWCHLWRWVGSFCCHAVNNVTGRPPPRSKLNWTHTGRSKRAHQSNKFTIWASTELSPEALDPPIWQNMRIFWNYWLKIY